MRTGFPAATVAVLLLLCGPAYLWADMSPILIVGSTIQPIREASVRMVSERVDIAIKDSTAYVTCRFVLRNEEKPKTLYAGFPSGVGPYPIRNFQAWVDQREIRVTHRDRVHVDDPDWRPPYRFFETFSVPFRSSGKTVTVTTRYRTPLLPEGHTSHFALEDLGFTYFLETGAFWKGTIDEAVVAVDFGSIPPGRISWIMPAGYMRRGNAFVWRFVNFEPGKRDNIQLSIIQEAVYDRMRLLVKHPEGARSHYLLGTVYFSRAASYKYQDGQRRAEEEFLKAVVLDPGMLDARYYLAWIHILRTERGKRPYSAMEQLREILRRDPEYICRDSTFPFHALRGTGIKDARASTLLSACENGIGRLW